MFFISKKRKGDQPSRRQCLGLSRRGIAARGIELRGEVIFPAFLTLQKLSIVSRVYMSMILV